MTLTERAVTFSSKLRQELDGLVPFEFRGRVLQVTGTIIKAYAPGAKIGELCSLLDPTHEQSLLTEVVGFENDLALLTPLGEIRGVSSYTEVIPLGRTHEVPVGQQLLGRVLDGLGQPSDGLGDIRPEAFYPVLADPPDAMRRPLIITPISLGIRAIDGLLTCGEGQRMGIFAAAGGGKSTLLSQIIRNTEAEIVVLALIGERGREVKEFLDRDLGQEGLRRSIVVIATSDRPSMERLKAAYVATAIAEFFRDQGKKVLFLMDSVTRFARALREIGLAAGEPPTRRGFPPSVFATLPRLMERSGRNEHGSITALYTVLVEGDDMTEPVADETRSILDGHIILSRKLGAANHYPAIDILASVSRLMTAIVPPDHLKSAGKIRSLLAKYQEIELLVQIGEYKAGSDAAADEALAKIGTINAFLKQGMKEKGSLHETVAQMAKLAG
jgi:type III secretion protein N (ATPase)